MQTNLQSNQAKKITTPGPCLGPSGSSYRTVCICSHAAQGANVSTAPVKVEAIFDNVNVDRVMKISEPFLATELAALELYSQHFKAEEWAK